MAELEVTCAARDSRGVVTALGGPWGTADVVSILHAMQLGDRYYVLLPDGTRAPVKHVPSNSGQYLRSLRDGTTRDNLDDLPRC